MRAIHSVIYLFNTLRYLLFLVGGLSSFLCLGAIFLMYLLPCEEKIYDTGSNPFFETLIYSLRLMLNINDFSGDSAERLKMAHPMCMLFITIFFINFIIALLSDHVAVLRSHIDYHFTMTVVRLSTHATYVANLLRALPVVRRWKKSRDLRMVFLEKTD